MPFLYSGEKAVTILNTICDFILLFIPLVIIYRSKLDLIKKLSILAVFSLGLFACVTSILKIVATRKPIQPGSDPAWDSVEVYIWTAVETAVSLTCACLTTIGPLFRRRRVPDTYGSNSMGQLQNSRGQQRLHSPDTLASDPDHDRLANLEGDVFIREQERYVREGSIAAYHDRVRWQSTSIPLAARSPPRL